MSANSSSSSLPYGSDATTPAIKPLRINKQQYMKEFQGLSSSKFRSKAIEKRVEDISKKLSPNLAEGSPELRNASSSYSPKKLESVFKNLENSPSTNHSRNFWNNLSNQQQANNFSPASSQSSIYSPFMSPSLPQEDPSAKGSEHQYNYNYRAYHLPKKSNLVEQNIDEIPYSHTPHMSEQSGINKFSHKPSPQLEHELQSQRPLTQGRVVMENLEKPSSCNSYITNHFTITRAGSISRLHGPRKMLGPEIKTSLLMKDSIDEDEDGNDTSYLDDTMDTSAADIAIKKANLTTLSKHTFNEVNVISAQVKTLSHSLSENDLATEKTLTHSKSKSCLMKHSKSSSPIKKAGEKKKNVSFVQGSPLVMEYECLTPEVDISSSFDISNHHFYQLPISGLNIPESYGFIQSYSTTVDLRNPGPPLDYNSIRVINGRQLPDIPQPESETSLSQNSVALSKMIISCKTIPKKASIEDRINQVYESLSLDDEDGYSAVNSEPTGRETYTRSSNDRLIRKSISRESLIDKDVYIKEALLDSVINEDLYGEGTSLASTDLRRQNSIQLEPESYQKSPILSPVMTSDANEPESFSGCVGEHIGRDDTKETAEEDEKTTNAIKSPILLADCNNKTIENYEGVSLFDEEIMESRLIEIENGSEPGFEQQDSEGNGLSFTSQDHYDKVQKAHALPLHIVQPLDYNYEPKSVSEGPMVASRSDVLPKLENAENSASEISHSLSDSHHILSDSIIGLVSNDDKLESKPIKVKAEYVDNYYRSNNYVVPSLSDTNIDYHLNASSTSYVKNEPSHSHIYRDEENPHPYQDLINNENEDDTLYANQLVYEQIGRLKSKSMENLRLHTDISHNNLSVAVGTFFGDNYVNDSRDQSVSDQPAPEVSLTDQIQAKVKSEQAIRDLQFSKSGAGLGLGLILDPFTSAVASETAIKQEINDSANIITDDDHEVMADLPVKSESIYQSYQPDLPLYDAFVKNDQHPQSTRSIQPFGELVDESAPETASIPEPINGPIAEHATGPNDESSDEHTNDLANKSNNRSVVESDTFFKRHVEEPTQELASEKFQTKMVEGPSELARFLPNASHELGPVNNHFIGDLPQSASLQIDLDNFDDSDDFASEFNDIFQAKSNVEQENLNDFIDITYPNNEHEIFQRLNDINVDAKDATIFAPNTELKIKPSATLANLSLLAQPLSDIIYGNSNSDAYTDMPSTPIMNTIRPESSYLQLSFDNLEDDNGSIFGDLEDEFEKISPTKKNSYFNANANHESEVSIDSPTKKSRYVVRESKDLVVAIGDKDGRFYNGKHRTVVSPVKKWQDIVNLDQKNIPPIPHFFSGDLAPKKQLHYDLLEENIPTGTNNPTKELKSILLFPLPTASDVPKSVSFPGKTKALLPLDNQLARDVSNPISAVHKAVQLPTEESGRLFVRVVGIKDLDLPFLDNMANSELAKFSLTLDNGIHCISTPYKPLKNMCSVDQEFELTVENDLEFIFTLKAICPERTKVTTVNSAVPSHAATQRQPLKEKRSTFSRFFSSPKKKQPLSKLKSIPTSIQSKVESVDIWENYVAIDGSFARSYISLSQYKKDIYGKVSNLDVYCFNEWAKDKKISSIPHAKLPPYRVGKLELQMMFIPRASRKEELPKSIKSAVDELNQASLLKPVYFEGTLAQIGGDCKYWRRRFFTLDGPTLTAFSESTKNPRATINLSKAEKVIGDKNSLMNSGVDSSKSVFDQSEEAFIFIDEGFRIKFTSGETLDFYADNKAQKYEWVNALSQVVGSSPVRKPWVDLVLAYKKSIQ